MATLTIRDLDDEIRALLRIRAAQHGRSMEAEVREILRNAVTQPATQTGLGSRIHEFFADLGDVELDLPERTDRPRSPDFS